jgi:prepilin-type N-terminal cleavage/methylation domain-containing protein
MKKAFTMIELIFVIVILGILAAVAIPKLSATRNDAKIASLAMSVGNSCMEIVGYALSNGATTNDLTLMSNGIAALVNTGDAYKSSQKVIVKIANVDCIGIEVVTNGNSDDLNVSYVTTTNKLCLALQNKVDKKVYSVPLRGSIVVE